MIRTLRSMLVGCACLTLGVVEHVQAQDAVLYVVTYIEVAPGAAAQGAALVKRFAAAGRSDRGNQRFEALQDLVTASRKEAGNARFEVFQQSSRPNHFSVVEVWRSEADYLAHIIAARTRLFRDQLGPMTGALYDERRYLAL